MRTLKTNLIVGFIFVSILGTLWHFVYEWSGDFRLLGFIAPINESTFEHMKLIREFDTFSPHPQRVNPLT